MHNFTVAVYYLNSKRQNYEINIVWKIKTEVMQHVLTMQ